MERVLKYLLYKSKALIDETSPEHNAILRSCQSNNGASGVSGFLHREDGFFLQYLEGPDDALDQTFDRITKDSRHTDVETIATAPLAKQHLPDWQMGFVAGDQLSLRDLLDVSEGELHLTTIDPMDLVFFMVANAEFLRETKIAA